MLRRLLDRFRRSDPISESLERTFTTGAGQVVWGVHSPKQCEGQHCVIHNPSDHSLSDAPTFWREDRGLMERICEHGIGHPDPDHLEFVRRTQGFEAARAESVHGCDGCCLRGDSPAPGLFPW